jgi:hypothetical protein
LRALIITGVAAVVAGGGVAALLIAQTSKTSASHSGPYQPFRAGFAVNLAAQIKQAPVFFPDPKRGNRAFFLDRIDERFVALHVLVPGRDRCVVNYQRDRHRYVDCDRHPLDPRSLAQFPIDVRGSGDSRLVYVDLRTRIEPPSTSSTRSALSRTSGCCSTSITAVPSSVAARRVAAVTVLR